MSFAKRSSWYLLLPFTVFIIDRFIKLQFWRSPELEISLIPRFLRLALHKNYGIGFSLQFPQTLTIILSFVLIIALISWLIKSGNKKTKLALVLILTGAVSNLIDRFFYGFVVDYISLFNISFINLSDLSIFAGIIFLIV